MTKRTIYLPYPVIGPIWIFASKHYLQIVLNIDSSTKLLINNNLTDFCPEIDADSQGGATMINDAPDMSGHRLFYGRT